MCLVTWATSCVATRRKCKRGRVTCRTLRTFLANSFVCVDDARTHTPTVSRRTVSETNNAAAARFASQKQRSTSSSSPRESGHRVLRGALRTGEQLERDPRDPRTHQPNCFAASRTHAHRCHMVVWWERFECFTSFAHVVTTIGISHFVLDLRAEPA